MSTSDRRHPALAKLSDRFCRIVFSAHPKEIRELFDEEHLLEIQRECRRAYERAGLFALLTKWVYLLWDLLLNWLRKFAGFIQPKMIIVVRHLASKANGLVDQTIAIIRTLSRGSIPEESTLSGSAVRENVAPPEPIAKKPGLIRICFVHLVRSKVAIVIISLIIALYGGIAQAQTLTVVLPIAHSLETAAIPVAIEYFNAEGAAVMVKYAKAKRATATIVSSFIDGIRRHIHLKPPSKEPPTSITQLETPPSSQIISTPSERSHGMAPTQAASTPTGSPSTSGVSTPSHRLSAMPTWQSTATAESSRAPSNTSRSLPTITIEATNEAPIVGSATATKRPTASATATKRPTASATATETPTASATATETPTASTTATKRPAASATATETPTASATPTETPIVTPELSACIVYAVSDHDSSDAELITIDLYTHSIKPIGPTYAHYGIEGLDIDPVTNILYAASDKDGDRPGYLYKVDKQRGIFNDIGDTGFDEGITELSFRPTDASLWGWARNKGLIRINTAIGFSTSIYSSTEHVEGMTWNSEGSLLYIAIGTDLWEYNPDNNNMVRVAASLPPSVDALEMYSSDKLIVSSQGMHKVLIYSLTTDGLAKSSGVIIPEAYADIEAMAWPSACMSTSTITQH